jgi:hypothetical protein
MALLAADSQEHSIVLHWLKKSAEKVGETLEFVGCLRLILISLSISKNIYLLVAWDLIEQAFRKFVPPITLHDMEIPTRLPVQVATLLVEIILTRLAWLFKRAKGEAPTGLRYLVNLLAERETGWCASGREAGFHGMWHTGFFSAPPYDVKCLEKMYTTIQGWHREQKEPEEIPQAFKDYITAQPLVQQFEGLARNKSVFCKP